MQVINQNEIFKIPNKPCESNLIWKEDLTKDKHKNPSKRTKTPVNPTGEINNQN